MKNLMKLYNECVCECENVGIEIGCIMDITVNTRAKRRWGQTSLRNGKYYISISSALLEDNVDDMAAKDTIMHEILHTCKGCFNHGAPWKAVANKINKAYPKYNIKRCTSFEEKGIKMEETNNFKYTVICEKCGQQFFYERAGKVVQNPKSYHCPCGGELWVKTNF